MSAARRLRSEVFVHTPFHQFGEPYLPSFPLLPDHRPQPAPDPLFQPFQHRRRLTPPEVAEPSPQIAVQFLDHPFDADPSSPARQFPYPILESLHRLRRDPPLWFTIRGEAESQELPLPWPRHRTLPSIDLKLQLGSQKTCEACHHPLSRTPAANVDITVVRVPRE